MPDKERITSYDIHPELIYKKPIKNPQFYPTRLKTMYNEMATKTVIGLAGFLTAGAGLAAFVLGARETNQLIAEVMLGLGSVPAVIGFGRSIMQTESLMRFISQKHELHLLTPNQLPWMAHRLIYGPQTKLQHDLNIFTQLMISRNWAEKVLEQREGLYGKIGTGAIQYDSHKLDTLPNAVKITRTKVSVARSIVRTNGRINRLDQRLLQIITKGNARPIIELLSESYTELLALFYQLPKDIEGYISEKEVDQFCALYSSFKAPFVRRAIELGTEDPTIYADAAYILLYSEDSEQILEERRKYLKKSIELDPEFTFGLVNFGSTFIDCLVYSDFQTYSIEEVVEVWRTLLQQTEANNSEEMKIIFENFGINIEKILLEIERLEALIQQRETFKRLEGLT